MSIDESDAQRSLRNARDKANCHGQEPANQEPNDPKAEPPSSGKSTIRQMLRSEHYTKGTSPFRKQWHTLFPIGDGAKHIDCADDHASKTTANRYGESNHAYHLYEVHKSRRSNSSFAIREFVIFTPYRFYETKKASSAPSPIIAAGTPRNNRFE
jgi:hypothetical protein